MMGKWTAIALAFITGTMISLGYSYLMHLNESGWNVFLVAAMFAHIIVASLLIVKGLLYNELFERYEVLYSMMNDAVERGMFNEEGLPVENIADRTR